ncbi:hypothetical protein [Elioraea sp.]|uniref:hypothetical protein n=1 Tax=Elioraea sp. TaxID=2185103 RepID=UPI0025C192E9|nr:hypothetical protein [Elioraea sp.]
MPTTARIVAIVLTAILVSGCATYHRGAETLRRPSDVAAIVMMPVDVEIFELSAGGSLEPKADWTEAAHRNLVEALRAEEAGRGLAFRGFDETVLTAEQRVPIDQVQRLHGAVGRAIQTHWNSGPLVLPAKQGRFDWTLGAPAAALRGQTGADYALFIWVRDSHSSPGRVGLIVAAAILGVSVPGGVQTGFASLVDLSTGEIVWFNRLLRGVGDLRTAEPARETARTLLDGFPR